MSGFNDYNTNTYGGSASDKQYETPYQTGMYIHLFLPLCCLTRDLGNDANTMGGLGGDQARTGYASAGAAGPTAGNMDAGGFTTVRARIRIFPFSCNRDMKVVFQMIKGNFRVSK